MKDFSESLLTHILGADVEYDQNNYIYPFRVKKKPFKNVLKLPQLAIFGMEGEQVIGSILEESVSSFFDDVTP